MKKIITVQAANIGQRLDKIIQKQFPQYSRAYLTDQIRLGNFLICPEGDQGTSGKKVKPSYPLQQNDQIILAPEFALPESAVIAPNSDIKLNIIFENDDVLVIDKPAGLSVHPRQDKNGLPLPKEIKSTLVSGLLASYPPLAKIGDLPAIRPGIIHRLDKDTSGVMIVAKNQPSFDWLKKQFKERLVAKKYLALVHGCPKEKQGLIKTLLARAKNDPTKQKISTREGKEAITEYQVIKELKDYSLIEARPRTGRLHQIRVHLAHLDHPVVSDAKYGARYLPAPPGLGRQFLHATELIITLPDGQEKTFMAPLPADLKTILAALEKISV